MSQDRLCGGFNFHSRLLCLHVLCLRLFMIHDRRGNEDGTRQAHYTAQHNLTLQRLQVAGNNHKSTMSDETARITTRVGIVHRGCLIHLTSCSTGSSCVEADLSDRNVEGTCSCEQNSKNHRTGPRHRCP